MESLTENKVLKEPKESGAIPGGHFPGKGDRSGVLGARGEQAREQGSPPTGPCISAPRKRIPSEDWVTHTRQSPSGPGHEI